MGVIKGAALSVILLMLGSWAVAQSNTLIDKLLGQKEATLDLTAYMVVVGGGWVKEDSPPNQALAFAMKQGWVTAGRSAEAAVSAEDFALLAMHGLRMEGGIGWSLFRTGRYAYRELVALGVYGATWPPGRILSGEDVIRLLGSLMGSDRRRP